MLNLFLGYAHVSRLTSKLPVRYPKYSKHMIVGS